MIDYLTTTNRVFYREENLRHFPDYKQELNKLFQEGKIKVHKGVNGKVIEVL